MLLRSLWLVIATVSALQSASLLRSDVVSGDAAYLYVKDSNSTVVFAQGEARNTATAKRHLRSIFLRYNQLFSWQLDQPLYVGLASAHNQIANGFSTQLPFNKQVNYPAGSAKIDYFCATSWLDMLLAHESTHNYQMNLKDNAVSKGLFSLFRNGYFMVPTFTIPNAVESSFLLEGNAVLHESIWGNGGRLFNGRLYAQTLLQAKAGYLNAPRMFNATYFFPYGEHFYAQGGFFWLYLAQTYGIKAVNRYFLYHSHDWYWPFITNANFSAAVGKNFETLLHEFAQSMRANAEQMHRTDAKIVASSKFYYPLNRDAKQIFFLINETGYSRAKAITINRATKTLRQAVGGWPGGRLFKHGTTYVSDASMPIAYNQVAYGLFDKNGHIVAQSAGRSYGASLHFSLENSAYMDMNRSFDRAHMVSKRPLAASIASNDAAVASTLFEDAQGDHYYFTQKGDTRTLYKNETALFSMQAHYGFVCDVDIEGGIYFIANSAYGSSIYRFKEGEISRVARGDDIVDMRLLDASTMLVAVVRSNGYDYVILPLQATIEAPAVVALHVPTRTLHATTHLTDEASVDEIAKQAKPYNKIIDMHYSGIALLLGANENSTLYDVRANFADLLSRDSASLYARRDSYSIDSAGAIYKNSSSRLNFLLHGFVVTSEQEAIIKAADTYGYEARAALILQRKGYDSSTLQASYLKNYTSQSRLPLEVALHHEHKERFGLSAFNNRAYTLNAYGVHDRSAYYAGASGQYEHELPWQSFIRVKAQYSGATQRKIYDDIGIKVASQSVEQSAIVMPGADFLTYVKHAAYGGATLGSVVDGSLYFFTFPISLRREIVSLEMRRYALFSNATQLDVNEWFAKLTLDLLWFNKGEIPFTMIVGQNSARISGSDAFAQFAFQLSF